MPARSTTASDWDGWVDGSHDAAYELFGAHAVGDSPDTWAVRVWAPNARAVAVVGDHNVWDGGADPMEPGPAGTWATTISAPHGSRYKFRIETDNGPVDKADPFAVHSEEPSGTASVLWDLDYRWGDHDWMSMRGGAQGRDRPISIYEIHLGSWTRPVSYRTVADDLIEHVRRCGFTHVEFMPLTEHPFYGSWGYQTTGYFAPTSRYGSPQDLMWLIDRLHQAGIGVIFDWVPSHFPTDEFALARFDGTALFEHPDPRRGHHPDWDSAIFDYGRPEVRAFLVSSARFWLDRYHVDALRVDAVASMLYLDYSRGPGEWEPNVFGGHENLEAIDFLRQLNTSVYRHHPDVHTIAEESTAYPGVTLPADVGGLGFGFKWDMGWMHDTLHFLSRPTDERSDALRELTGPSAWALTENYVLPLSHDEVVHGKRSLIGRMPGDEWRRQAGLRLLLGWQWTHPGKKLLFMGGELGLEHEWAHESPLPWRPDGPQRPASADAVVAWVTALNTLYREHPALHRGDHGPGGFAWVIDASADGVVAFVRADPSGADAPILVVVNVTAAVHERFDIGVPVAGTWSEILSSDDERFGGSGVVNAAVDTVDDPRHGQPQRITVRVGPLAVAVWGPES